MEYTGLSYVLRDLIPIMQMLKDIKDTGFTITSTTPKVTCEVFEDNSGAVDMEKVHKHISKTKHHNVKLHHFRDYVTRG